MNAPRSTTAPRSTAATKTRAEAAGPGAAAPTSPPRRDGLPQDGAPQNGAPLGADAPGLAGSGPWRAELALQFRRVGARTVLTRRRHEGPLLVQRPFYPEGEAVAHTVVLHPPGGLVGGDELALEVDVGPGAQALLTTPAANKVYRCPRAPARQAQEFRVAAGGMLEWLPQETLAFQGAKFVGTTRIHLEPGAGFFGWEVLCLGRPAAGEGFARGAWLQNTELYCGERLLWREQARYLGGDPLLDAPWGLHGRPVSALLLVRTDEQALAAIAREAVGAAVEGPNEPILLPCGGHQGISAYRGVLVARYLGAEVEAARAWLLSLWRALRPHLVGRGAEPPRIWNC
ncbi:MAG: urease accessory protein UreD [SAR324 cluster bacterium]|nr:urease accessory protein UreD [SAR324 cluster bacterium]